MSARYRRNDDPPKPERGHVVIRYDYEDHQGRTLYRHVRWEPKDFTWERSDGNGGWIPHLKQKCRNTQCSCHSRWLPKLSPVLYGYRRTREAAARGEPIYVTEGEKAADRLSALGVSATCAGGAKNWHDEFGETLRGAHVVVLVDNDDVGRAYANAAARSCVGKAESVKVLALDGLAEHGDVFDWLAAGHNVAELQELAAQAPEWQGGDEPAESVRTWTWAELEVAAQAEPPEQLVESLMASGDRFLIFAFAGVGKSLVGLHLAVALHRGTDFLDHFKTRRARVGYVDEESSTTRLGQRLGQIARGQGIDAEHEDLPRFRVQAGERLDTDSGVERVAAWIRDESLDVLIVDTLRRVHQLQENEADDMAKIEKAIRELQRRGRDDGRPLTVVLIHHSPKPRQGGSNAPETMARGSSDILAAMDGALYLYRSEGDIKVEHAKARWSAPLEPFIVKISATDDTLTMVHGGAAPEKRSQPQRIGQCISLALHSEPGRRLSRQTILARASAAGYRRAESVRDVLREMVDSGRVRVDRVGREAFYTLVGEDF